MINILLNCAGGMSTSIMINKRKKVSEEYHLQIHIWTVGEIAAQEHIKKADVVLLGSQILHLRYAVSEICSKKPIAVMGIRGYGMMDGAKILYQILDLAKQNSSYRNLRIKNRILQILRRYQYETG